MKQQISHDRVNEGCIEIAGKINQALTVAYFLQDYYEQEIPVSKIEFDNMLKIAKTLENFVRERRKNDMGDLTVDQLYQEAAKQRGW